MSYVVDSLSKNEKVVEVFKLHWILKVLIVFCFILIPFTFSLSLIVAIMIIITILTTEHAVTNKRVIFKKGLIARHTEEIKLNRIETIEIQQGILGRILGYGTVKLTGTGNGIIVFKTIDNPLSVKQTIEDTIENEDPTNNQSVKVAEQSTSEPQTAEKEQKSKNEQKVFEEDGYTVEYKY